MDSILIFDGQVLGLNMMCQLIVELKPQLTEIGCVMIKMVDYDGR